MINKHRCSSIPLLELSNYIRLRHASRSIKYMVLLKFTRKLNENNSIHHLSMKEKVIDVAVVRIHLICKKCAKWVQAYLCTQMHMCQHKMVTLLWTAFTESFCLLCTWKCILLWQKISLYVACKHFHKNTWICRGINYPQLETKIHLPPFCSPLSEMYLFSSNSARQQYYQRRKLPVRNLQKCICAPLHTFSPYFLL